MEKLQREVAEEKLRLQAKLRVAQEEQVRLAPYQKPLQDALAKLMEKFKKSARDDRFQQRLDEIERRVTELQRSERELHTAMDTLAKDLEKPQSPPPRTFYHNTNRSCCACTAPLVYGEHGMCDSCRSDAYNYP